MSFFTKLPENCYSEDAFNRFEAGRELSLGTAAALAWMSQLAYETDNTGGIEEVDKVDRILSKWHLKRIAVLSKEVKTVLPIASTHLLIASDEKDVFVAFAGTDPIVVANWVTDFDINLGQTGAAAGYQTAAAAVLPDIEKILRELEGCPVYFTGHSLGGSLAAIAGFELQSARSAMNIGGIYTFGMPRPGNAAFAAKFGDLKSCTFRFVYGEDVVPSVAPSSLGFRHVGRYLHCLRGATFSSAGDPDFGNAPEFSSGVSREFIDYVHTPLSALQGVTNGLRQAVSVASGNGPPGMRTDLASVAIEMLPPRLRDHMPDRYIGALSPA